MITVPSKINRNYGYLRSPHKNLFAPRFQSANVILPPSVDLQSSCPPVYDQGQLGSCHDAKTEVLTNIGWKAWPDITGSELLGTVNPINHLLEFQAPSVLQRYDYDGEMCFSDHRAVDFSLTPNHRMYTRRWNQAKKTLSDSFEFREVKDMGWYAGLLASPVGTTGVEIKKVKIGEREYSGDQIISLIALVASDGWVGGTLNNINTVSFCCYRDDRLMMVKNLAHELGLHPLPGRQNVWKWSDAALASWFRENLFTGHEYRSPFKKIPDLVKCTTPSQMRLFLAFFGDQHIQNDSRSFYSSSSRLISDLQELLLRTGKRGTIMSYTPKDVVMRDGREIHAENCVTAYQLYERKTDRLSIERKQIKSDHYKGEVFCATVPNSTLITRRNGSVLVSGNCTANAIAAAYCFERIQAGLPFVTPSRLFIYWNERVMEGDPQNDSGAYGGDGLTSLETIGVPDESVWPYDVTKFAVAPVAAAFAQAPANKIQEKQVLVTLDDIKGALFANHLVPFGISVYESFESPAVAATGMVPDPKPGEGCLGGHEICIVAYDDSKQMFKIRNSWGPGWGIAGYCWMSYNYVMAAGSDFEVITKI